MPNPNSDENPKSPNQASKSNNDVDESESKIEESNAELQSNSSSNNEVAVVDVSGKSLELSLIDNSRENSSIEEVYVYKNEFNLIPKSLGGLTNLKTFKFFANEVNVFPEEFGELVGLECLQVKVSSSVVNGMSLGKFKGLKELEISKVPRRPSALPLLAEIAGLKSLTKLSVCHFNIRYLPPEIGYLKNLEYLDLSSNRMKNLPEEISCLTALTSLNVANNKLEELPSGLSSLQRLKSLDLSNNRLKTMGSLELSQMRNLQTLNLQYNMLISVEIPSWICCNLEGNGRNALDDNSGGSSVEMDVYESIMQEDNGSTPQICSNRSSSSLSSMALSSSRYFATRRSGKRWKRRYYLQQKARQERLNNSRKLKGDEQTDDLNMIADETCKPSNADILGSDIACLNDDEGKQLHSGRESENPLAVVEDENIGSQKKCVSECLSVVLDSGSINKGKRCKCSDKETSLVSLENEVSGQDEVSFSDKSQSAKSKRHSDRDLDNPKPCKFHKPTDNCFDVSHKYSSVSVCGIDDCLVDGFYDAGRDRPFVPLRTYEQSFHPDSREVILLDRHRDEELDAIVLTAQALVHRLKQFNGLPKDGDSESVDNMQITSLLALFVSDHFGGSDRSSSLERTRKAVSGSNYRKPFVCTCSTGTRDCSDTISNQKLENVEEIIFSDLCERSLRSIKARQNSIIVPLGTLKFGVCRHRALLLKYLCDRMEPPVPCELVRGYLDFQPHAWNTILAKQGDSWVRMVVDACHPLDIREETEPEFFCRYIPLCRTNVSLSSDGDSGCVSFPSLSTRDEIETAGATSLIRCKFGAVDAAAKVRTLEVCGTAFDKIKEFEYSCIGEVRILGSLKHPCIVELYGHQIVSKWLPSDDGTPEHRILKSAILMEYVEGGSLKGYLKKLSEAGEKHVPVDLAFSIARGVALALAEMHSKHIIHRDIKSENVLIDLDRKVDGMPVVKVCDFDRAVPLRSYLHTCCIGHLGIPPPDVCVGTPRWMAPEVLQAMHKPKRYGLEVDIWSYGCLLMELLTLQVPYSGLSESDIFEMLQMGKRPHLTDEMEALRTLQEAVNNKSGTEVERTKAELETHSFLVDLFYQCTQEDPADRPTAEGLCEMLHSHTSSLTDSRKLGREVA